MKAPFPSPLEPPHAQDAERCVLGGLLRNNDAWFEIADRLSEQDFYTDAHRTIYRHIGALIGERQACDFVTLADRLRMVGVLDDVGGIAYLGNLAADVPAVSNIMAYARIVRERSVLRRMIACGQDIAGMAYDPADRDVGELIDLAEQRVFAIRNLSSRGSGEVRDMPALMEAVERRIDELRRDPGGLRGLSSGFAQLDAITAGLHGGDLTIVAGRPGMGKTAFAVGIAQHAAIELGVACAVFSMEMSAEQLATRIASSYSRIDQQRLRTGALTDDDFERLVEAGARLRQAPLYIDDTGSLSPLELRARARRMAARYKIGLIVVDYIQLMQVPNTKENRTNEVSEISRSLKALARELAIPIVAISQLNRNVEARDNRRPRMSDLRDSGGLEQDSDVILFVYRDDYYNKDSPDAGTAEIIVAKHRNGPTGTVRLGFDGRFTRFFEIPF